MNSDPERYKISIVIPVYNSEQSIGRLAEELIDKLLPAYRLEIVLVNDCSPDHSEEICAGLARKYPGIIRYYGLSINSGEHNAVMAGLNQATGKFAVIMDDDFQNPVSEVIRLIDFMLNNDFDVVYTFYAEKKHSSFRNLGSRLNDKMANIMLKKDKNLYLSSFKIINRFLINEIIKYTLPFPYIDGLILRTTSKIGKIEVTHNIRETGKSNYTLRKLISLWLNSFTNFSILPLRLTMILGFIFSIVGFIIGIYTFIEKLENPDLPAGYASLIVIISVFAGIQLIALGIVGEYLGRVFMGINKKPQYTIRKSIIEGKSDGEK